MLMQVEPTEFETVAYETEIQSKTFRISLMGHGSWQVLSHDTKQPSARYFWGCKTFPTLAAIEKHYKGLRSVVMLLEAPADAVAA